MADIYSILAGKGRKGDKYIRNVLGEPSHVNEVEKDAIDTYGLVGQVFTAISGSGTINPDTGLREYYDDGDIVWIEHPTHRDDEGNPMYTNYRLVDGQWKFAGRLDAKRYVDQQGGVIVDELPPPTANLTGGGTGGEYDYNNDGTVDALDVTLAPDDLKQTIADSIISGESTGFTTSPISDIPDFGMEDIDPEDFMGKTPSQAADWIIKTKYAGQEPVAPEGSGGWPGGTFKNYLLSWLETSMPQLQPVPEEEIGFAEGRLEQDVYKLRGETGKIGQAMQNVYGGMGAGFRAGVAGMSAIGEGFDFAQTGFKEELYGLGEKAKSAWETNWSKFLSSLPPAIGQ